LSFIELESILKIASTNIDDIPANQVATGHYGSGTLNTGNAVKLMYDLMVPLQVAYLENQKFTRWDFVFNAVSQNVIMQNQEFTQASTVILTAKNEITLKQGTLLEPNQDGFTVLEIDPNLEIVTNCPGFAPVHSVNDNHKKIEESNNRYKVYPTLVDTEINILNTISKDAILETVIIYDIFSQEVFSRKGINEHQILLEVSWLPQGIYILKGYDTNLETIVTVKFIKK